MDSNSFNLSVIGFNHHELVSTSMIITDNQNRSEVRTNHSITKPTVNINHHQPLSTLIGHQESSRKKKKHCSQPSRTISTVATLGVRDSWGASLERCIASPRPPRSMSPGGRRHHRGVAVLVLVSQRPNDQLATTSSKSMVNTW